MDRIDALEGWIERLPALSRGLLAETDDEELQQIVQEAAHELSSPIALVTLVLEEVQFFKAHTGLPAPLEAARSTRRDVSFCQFVVRDDAPFEVNDASSDRRVPQYLVEEYGVRAYLGVPVRTGDVPLGSLCVLDTKEREFDAADREQLQRLATRVEERLDTLLRTRQSARSELTQHGSLAPGVAELRETLAPVRPLTASGQASLVAMRSFLRLFSHAMEGGRVSSEALTQGLDAADEALEHVEDLLDDLHLAALDAEDCVGALEQLGDISSRARLSQVISAAQDLSRQKTRSVGGAPLPDLTHDPLLSAAHSLAVGVVSSSLQAVATRLSRRSHTDGIQMRVRDLDRTTELILSSPGLPDADAEAIATELAAQIGEQRGVQVHPLGSAVRIAFRVVGPEAEPA